MTDNTPISKVSRLEVISTGARRRWTLEEKHRIVAESYSGPRMVSVTARRNGLSTSQLFTWRRRRAMAGMSCRLLFSSRSHLGRDPHRSARRKLRLHPLCSAQGLESIDIEFGGGCRVRVDRDVDTETLQRVLDRLRRR